MILVFAARDIRTCCSFLTLLILLSSPPMLDGKRKIRKKPFRGRATLTVNDMSENLRQ